MKTSPTSPTPEMQHRTLGGSTAERWVNCHGSVSLAQNIAKPPAGPRAERGTLLHGLAEKAGASYLSKKATGHGLPGVLEELSACEDDEGITWVVRYAELIFDRVLNSYATDKTYDFETEFTLHEGLDMGGTADFWAVYRDEKAKRVLVIADFKTGHHEVEITSLQFLFYACAAREFLLDNGKDIDYVRCAVIQPPLGDHVDPSTQTPNDYKEIKYTVKQLDSAREKFLKAGRAIYEEGSTKLKVGDWCRWCPAQGVCPAYGKKLEEVTALKIIDSNQIQLPEVEQLSDEQIALLVTWRKPFEAFFKSVAKLASARLQVAGGAIAGLKLVKNRGKRTWIKDNDLIEESLKPWGVFETEIFTKKVKGMGAIKEHIMSRGFTSKEAEEVIDSLVISPPESVSVVPESDKREAVEAPGSLLVDESINVETDEEL